MHGSAMSRSQQDLLDDVRRRISQLEEAIRHINITKKNLKENSMEVKSQIHGAISRQLETLRSREVWLLNQVEVIQQAKEDLLRQQQDQLNVALGGLQNSLRISSQSDVNVGPEEGATGMHHSLTDTLQKSINLKLGPDETPYISFRADVPKLREGIFNFGRIDSRGLPIETAFADPDMTSQCLPNVFEDYGDAEHHILYKTVEEIKNTKHNDTSIMVNIPKLSPKPEDWLFQPTGTPPVKSTPSKLVFSPFRSQITDWLAKPGVGVPTEVQEGSSKMSITQWLCQMRNDSEVEMEEDDFELISPSSGHPETDTSDSIEVMSQSGSTTSTLSPGSLTCATAAYFSQISATPPSNWLVNAGAATTQAFNKLKYFRDMESSDKDWLSKSNKKVTDSPLCSRACVAVPTSLDIENLDKLLCVEESVSKYFREVPCDHQSWLLSGKNAKTSENQNAVVNVPNVREVCRANEACESFSECVCDENCCQTLAAMETHGADVTSEWLTSSVTSSKNISRNSSVESFKNIPTPPSDWLFSKESVENTSCHFPLFKHISQNQSDWLKTSQPSANKNSPKLTNRDHISSEDNTDWLINRDTDEVKSDKEKYQINEKWAEQSCHSEVIDSQWLCRSSTSLNDLTDVVMKKMVTDDGDFNKWLSSDNVSVPMKHLKELSLSEKELNFESLFPVFQSDKESLGRWLIKKSYSC